MTLVVEKLFEATLTQALVVYFTADHPTRIDELHVHSRAPGVSPVTVSWNRTAGGPVAQTHNMHPGETWDFDAIIGQTLASGDTLSAGATAKGCIDFTGTGTVST